MIHFITANLDRQVHAQALGFTTTVYMHGWGSSPEEAAEHVKAYLKGIGVGVTKISSAATAVKQDLMTYAFPEQIHGLPNDAAIQAIRSQGLPEEWIEDTVRDLAKRQQTTRNGRLLLAQEVSALATA